MCEENMLVLGRSETLMTVLFGTIEYFEREILEYTAKYQFNTLTNHQILMLKSSLENELLNEFVCDEHFRMECLENLAKACKKILDLEMCTSSI